nr:immunoglobulin light chain junction region [Macaca mulatta]
DYYCAICHSSGPGLF